MTPAPVAAEKNTKNAVAKIYKMSISGYQDNREQGIRESGYQVKKRKHRATWCYPMFSGGEKIFPSLLSAANPCRFSNIP